jgi:hypothetical protein
MHQDTRDRLNFACGLLQGVASVVRDETVAAVATNDHIEVIKHYDDLRHLNALIKESREALAQIEERLSREYVPDVMRHNKVKSITVEVVSFYD